MSYTWDVDCYPEPGEYSCEGREREVRTYGFWDRVGTACVVTYFVGGFFYCGISLLLQILK